MKSAWASKAYEPVDECADPRLPQKEAETSKGAVFNIFNELPLDFGRFPFRSRFWMAGGYGPPIRAARWALPFTSLNRYGELRKLEGVWSRKGDGKPLGAELGGARKLTKKELKWPRKATPRCDQ